MRAGYKLFLEDSGHLKRDEAARMNPKAKRLFIRDDRFLLIDDKQIWLAEMKEQEVIEHNINHPEHQLADLKSTLTLLRKIRDDFSTIVAEFGKQF